MRRVLIGLVVFLLLVGSLLPAVAEAVPSSECVRLTQEAVGESLGKDTPGAALTVFENGICECEKELKNSQTEFKSVELGVMIETPSAVLISDLLAKEVAFFSNPRKLL